MKKFYLFFISGIFFTAANAQFCLTCTSTITGNNSSPQVVTSGQTLCIAAGATLSGDILVQGGEVCNAGTVTSQHVLVKSGGVFENYATVDVDSFLVSEAFSIFDNRGTVTCERIAVNDSASIVNNAGTITCNFLGDSAASFHNAGNITVNSDLSNGYNATFQNAGYLHIGRDFYNGYDATFNTTCVVDVLRDWYNSADVFGVSGPSCSGFRIGNGSYNSGLVVFADLCDLNTAGTIDGNTGTLTMVTHCSCNNFCQEITSVEEIQENDLFSIYPNPATEKITVYSRLATETKISIETMDGKKVIENKFDSEYYEVLLQGFQKGTYLLTLYTSDNNKLLGRKLFIIN